ncbi:MAG: mechanosensitive ion channel [Rhizobiales bacterium]|nr:mechanosensitive ion channel [Hyphomicrobiales bacterium]
METNDEAPSDSEIDQRLEGIFDEIDGLQNVHATVAAGVVTLTGEVNEQQYAEKAATLAKRVDGVVAVNNEIIEQTAVTERLVPVLGRFEKRLGQAVDYLPLVMIAVAVWLCVSAFGWFIASRCRPWSWLAPNAFISELIRQFVRIVFLVIGAVLALDILGATAVLGTILGAAGIVGLAIGFAVRDTVENYIASILLSIRQPFQPKELVHIDGFEGHVIRLTSRATILMDRDGNHIRIPNATVFKSKIVNYSRNPERRFTFELGVDADSVLEDALAICLEELRCLEFVLDDPAPAAWIEAVGDSNVVIGLAGWVDQTYSNFVKARSESIRRVKLRLEESGFALPEPIYRLRFDNAPSGVVGGVASTRTSLKSRRETPQRTSGEVVSAKASDAATDTTVDKSVVKKVDEERARDKNANDLLSDQANDELG